MCYIAAGRARDSESPSGAPSHCSADYHDHGDSDVTTHMHAARDHAPPQEPNREQIISRNRIGAVVGTDYYKTHWIFDNFNPFQKPIENV